MRWEGPPQESALRQQAPPTSRRPRLCARLPSSPPSAQSAALWAQRSRRLCGRWRPTGTLASRGARRPATCAARERALSLLSPGRTGSRRLDGDSPPLPPGGKDPRAPSRAGWRRWPRRRREERYSPVATASPPAEAAAAAAAAFKEAAGPGFLAMERRSARGDSRSSSAAPRATA